MSQAVNNFSVMSGQVFLSWTSTKQWIKCLIDVLDGEVVSVHEKKQELEVKKENKTHQWVCNWYIDLYLKYFQYCPQFLKIELQ